MATYTANSLLDSTRKLASWRGTGYASTEGLRFVQCIPFAGMKTVVYEWHVKPSPIKRNKDGSFPKNVNKPSFYRVFLSFGDVQFAEEGDEIPSDNTWSLQEYKGMKFYFQKPAADKNPIRVSCTCPDYTIRGAYPNHKSGVHYGPLPKKVVRKTPAPPEGRPYVNPLNVPILCKHEYACIARSITEGWLLGKSM